MPLNPETFLETLRNSFYGSVQVYTEGGCWQLHKILKLVFPDAKPYYDPIEGHVYTEIGGKYYDIEGAQRPTQLDKIPNEDLSLAELESWRYN